MDFAGVGDELPPDEPFDQTSVLAQYLASENGPWPRPSLFETLCCIESLPQSQGNDTASVTSTSYSARSSASTYHSARSKRSNHVPSVPMVVEDAGETVVEEESSWINYLRDMEILPEPFYEQDWSGKGQHVEFDTLDEVPLVLGNVLGHSANAVVQSVMCRRIRLAQKTINCRRRITKEEAVLEVKHLQRLQHSHIIQVVGTYVLNRDLSILLYPVAEYNLTNFLEYIEERPLELVTGDSSAERMQRFDLWFSLARFFRCLASTVHFIHGNCTKHMDIKPQNLLVKHDSKPCWSAYKIYIADFGIARSYESAADAETDSRLQLFTRTYSAPEVVDQAPRGFPADIFSLGCVYAEMLDCLIVPSNRLRDVRRANAFGDTSYQANIPQVQAWLEDLDKSIREEYSLALDLVIGPKFLDLVKSMLLEDPLERPHAFEVVAGLMRPGSRAPSCLKCWSGPDPYEAAVE